MIEDLVAEAAWNKNSSTPRDYSKEYNAPGSKKQEERNKRKRDKRKHDREHGECPPDQELHHINGVEEDEVSCEPISKNRGRKGEGARYSKDIKIKISKSSLQEVVIEETEAVIYEIFGSLAAKAVDSMVDKATDWGGEKMADIATNMIFGDDEDDSDEHKKDITDKKLASLNLGSYDDVRRAIDGIFKKASKKNLSGKSDELEKSLEAAPELMKHLGR